MLSCTKLIYILFYEMQYLVPVMLHIMKQEPLAWGECSPEAPGPLALVVASDVRQATDIASHIGRLQECAEFGGLCCAVTHRGSAIRSGAMNFVLTVNSRPVLQNYNLQRAHLLVIDVDRLLMLLRQLPPNFFDRYSQSCCTSSSSVRVQHVYP